jgi:hypothetical protein
LLFVLPDGEVASKLKLTEVGTMKMGEVISLWIEPYGRQTIATKTREGHGHMVHDQSLNVETWVAKPKHSPSLRRIPSIQIKSLIFIQVRSKKSSTFSLV